MFYQEWFAQGVYSICDILDSSGMYLNFADPLQISVGNFQLNVIFSSIFKLCRLSLKDCWKGRETLFGNNSIFTPGNSTFHLSPSLLIDLSKLTCKDYYWFFFNRREPCATGPSK